MEKENKGLVSEGEGLDPEKDEIESEGDLKAEESKKEESKKEEVLKNQFKECILSSDSLIIKENGLFLDENGEVKFFLRRERFTFTKVMEEVNWKGAHRVYFSIPCHVTRNKSDSDPEPEPPVARFSLANVKLNAVIPQWTRIEKDWFDSKFSQLDKQFESIWSKLGKPTEDGHLDETTNKDVDDIYRLFESSFLYRDVELEEGARRRQTELQFFGFSSVLKKYLKILGLRGGYNLTDNDLNKPLFNLSSDFKVNNFDRLLNWANKDKTYFFINFTRHGLINYVNEDRSLKDTSGMRSLMRETLKQMLAVETDCCMISDMEVSIMVQLNFEANEGKSIYNVASIPFKYYVCYTDDQIYTLQAIICSMCYDQKLRGDDPTRRENIKKLETLLVNKDKKINPPPSSKKTKKKHK